MGLASRGKGGRRSRIDLLPLLAKTLSFCSKGQHLAVP